LGCPSTTESFPEAGSYRYAILDRDTKFDDSGITLLQATGLTAKRTGVRVPWQNGTAEPWIGSCRGELLDHMIALNGRHLLRMLRDYVSYHHQDRIHDSLGKDMPETRPVEPKPTANATLISLPRLGGLHHR
jgi:transposase InsO family protein